MARAIYLRRRGRPAKFVCVEVIRGLHGQGFSFREIARCTGVGYGTVRRAFHGQSPLGADLMAGVKRRKAKARRAMTATA